MTIKVSRSSILYSSLQDQFFIYGKHFQKHGGKLLIKPSQRNVQTFLAEIKTTFKENLHAPVDRLLMHLNPKIGEGDGSNAIPLPGKACFEAWRANRKYVREPFGTGPLTSVGVIRLRSLAESRNLIRAD